MPANAGDYLGRRRWLEAIVAADRDAGGVRTDRSRYLAAVATLELTAASRDAFQSIPLVAPLKDSMASKKSAMERALAGYQQAVGYAVAEVTTAATYEMGELYRRLAADLMKSERPASLDPDSLEQYDLLLEEQAFPFEEKAVAIHEINARRVADGLYDEWVRQSYAVLAEVKPARFGKRAEPEPFVAQLELATRRPLQRRCAPATAPATEQQFARAVQLLEAGDFAGARPLLEQLVASEPALSAPAVNLGMLHARERRWAEAETALAEGYRRNPADAVALNELAAVQRERRSIPGCGGNVPSRTRRRPGACAHAPQLCRPARSLPVAPRRGAAALRDLRIDVGDRGPPGLRLDRRTQAARRRSRADRRSAAMKPALPIFLILLAPIAVAQDAMPPRAAPAAEPAVTVADPAPPATMDHLELDPTAITGNRELPKVMVIVPWKKADRGDLTGRPANSLLNEVLEPVDREVFRRELRYFEALDSNPET